MYANHITQHTKTLMIGLLLGLLGGAFLLTPTPVAAQGGTTTETEPLADLDRPFQLPFADPASLDTWLMAQPYGNTTGAFRQRFTTYGASGGIHFGVDLSAPCGTEVVAIADGIVFAVDGPFGSPPHNLMIDHPELGYASMYGHLLEAPNLRPGQSVEQGQVVALTGDSQETCFGRPHLHLEIRDLAHVEKYNPMALIESDWHNLILIGDQPRDFARDLTAPRKWQSLYDQPRARTGGPIINDFTYPWPFDWENGSTLPRQVNRSASLRTEPALTPVLKTLPVGQQVTVGGCCTQAEWDSTSSELRFLDQPTEDAPLGLWAVDITDPERGPRFTGEPLGELSPDGRLVAYPDRQNNGAIVERLRDGQQWQIDTAGENPRFTPDSQSLVWTTSDPDAPRDSRLETTWLAEIGGDKPEIIFEARRTDTIAWLADDQWLMSRRIPGTSNIQLYTRSLSDGDEEILIERLPRIRGTELSPNQRYMVYYVTFEPEPAENGVWLFDLQRPALPPRKLPFFGSYRWRDNRHLIYVPFDAEASEHNFYEYDVFTRRSEPLFPDGTGLTIANHEWQVSPDGQKISLLAAKGTALDGLWVLPLP